ncbi:MAG: hypothetical protein V9G16_01945, partial [Nitrosomonas sp.]
QAVLINSLTIRPTGPVRRVHTQQRVNLQWDQHECQTLWLCGSFKTIQSEQINRQYIALQEQDSW